MDNAIEMNADQAGASNQTGNKKLNVFEGLDPEIKIRTRKMMMWFIIFAIVMLFAGVTSAIIVLNGKLIWLHISPPVSLWISILLVALSSATMILAVKAVKAGNQKRATALTILTLIMGIGFTISQNQGWKALSDRGLGYTITQNEQGLKSYRWNTLGKISGTYGTDYWFEMNNEKLVLENGEYYIPSQPATPVTNTVMTTFNAGGAMISVLIYVHILHLFFGLIYMVINIVRLAKGVINKDNSLSLYIGGMYWHFMGLLWAYLFFFLFFIY